LALRSRPWKAGSRRSKEFAALHPGCPALSSLHHTRHYEVFDYTIVDPNVQGQRSYATAVHLFDHQDRVTFAIGDSINSHELIFSIQEAIETSPRR
jgi:hypothetical protein